MLLQVGGGHSSPASGQRVSQDAYFVLEGRNSYLEKFLKEHPFWEGVGLLLCEPDHTFFKSIHSAKHPFFYSSFSSNHPSPKCQLRHGI